MIGLKSMKPDCSNLKDLWILKDIRFGLQNLGFRLCLKLRLELEIVLALVLKLGRAIVAEACVVLLGNKSCSRHLMKHIVLWCDSFPTKLSINNVVQC